MLSRIVNDRQKIRVAGDVQMEEHLFDNQKIFIFSTSGFSNHSEVLSRKASAQKDALKKIKNYDENHMKFDNLVVFNPLFSI